MDVLGERHFVAAVLVAGHWARGGLIGRSRLATGQCHILRLYVRGSVRATDTMRAIGRATDKMRATGRAIDKHAVRHRATARLIEKWHSTE